MDELLDEVTTVPMGDNRRCNCMIPVLNEKYFDRFCVIDVIIHLKRKLNKHLYLTNLFYISLYKYIYKQDLV